MYQPKKPLNVFGLLFPHLSHGNNNSRHLLELLRGLSKNKAGDGRPTASGISGEQTAFPLLLLYI